jgi:hypothetical protein
MENVRPRTSSTIPFGYDPHPENSHLIVENSKHQEVIKNLKELVNFQSLRKLAGYIEAHTGRKITPRGISKILKRKY